MSSLKDNFCCYYVFTRLRYIVEMAMLRACKENLCLLSLALQLQHVLSGRETSCTCRRQNVSTQNCMFFFYRSPVDTRISLGTATSCISDTQSNHKLLTIPRTTGYLNYVVIVIQLLLSCLHQHNEAQQHLKIPWKKTDVYVLSPLTFFVQLVLVLGFFYPARVRFILPYLAV